MIFLWISNNATLFKNHYLFALIHSKMDVLNVFFFLPLKPVYASRLTAVMLQLLHQRHVLGRWIFLSSVGRALCLPPSPL